MPNIIQNHIYPIQKLPNGDTLNVYVTEITSPQPGPTVYFQANLHGPEVIGTTIIANLIEKLEKIEFVGNIILVPCANPMGVNTLNYNSTAGRWNPQNGNNWNRIFDSTLEFTTKEEKQIYFANKIENPNGSIENRIANLLGYLCSTANFIVDIHTTGYQSVPHLFTYCHHSKYFNTLANIHLTNHSLDHLLTAFDDVSLNNFYKAYKKNSSNKLPFHESTEFLNSPIACTLEASSHSHIYKNELEMQTNNLLNWLQEVWKNTFNKNEVQKYSAEKAYNLVLEDGGYLVWQVEIGDIVKKGEIYGKVYNVSTNIWLPQKAQQTFLLISKYASCAVGSGNEIGWVVDVDEKI